MVTVTSIRKSLNESGKEFFSLELHSGVEAVQSKATGRYYLTSKTCLISTTFDEAICQELIGKSLPGSVVKVPCEPYEYTMKDTGEVIRLEHRWEYTPEETPVMPKQNYVISEQFVIG